MTIFLRNQKNETLVDIELNNGTEGMDLRSVVIIETYSKLQVVHDFSEISELRGWFWEVYMEMTSNISLESAFTEVNKILLPIAKRHNLNLITD